MKKNDGSSAVSAQDKAEALNEFFASVFTNEDLENLPCAPTYGGELLDSFNITAEIVLKKLLELKPGKSPGKDGWHPVFLKSIGDLIAAPLAKLFQ